MFLTKLLLLIALPWTLIACAVMSGAHSPDAPVAVGVLVLNAIGALYSIRHF